MALGRGKLPSLETSVRIALPTDILANQQNGHNCFDSNNISPRESGSPNLSCYPRGFLLSFLQVCASSLQALWAQFKPEAAVVDADSWTMSKMGSPISPLEVVLNGSQSMHAVDDEGIMVEGLGLQRSWEQLQIRQASFRQHQCGSA